MSNKSPYEVVREAMDTARGISVTPIHPGMTVTPINSGVTVTHINGIRGLGAPPTTPMIALMLALASGVSFGLGYHIGRKARR